MVNVLKFPNLKMLLDQMELKDYEKVNNEKVNKKAVTLRDNKPNEDNQYHNLGRVQIARILLQ